MKIITKTFILFVVLLLPLVLFGQTNSLSSEKYWAALNEAESKTDKQMRKEVKIQTFYTNGEVTGTSTGTSEYIPPDKSIWVNVEQKGSVVKRIEQITIGNLIYRKEDKGTWVKREKGDGGFGIGGTEIATREFLIENETIGKEKFQVLIFRKVNYNQTYFDESKTWINSKGLMLKKRSTTSHNDLKNIVSTVDVDYGYMVKPSKIEAPIK